MDFAGLGMSDGDEVTWGYQEQNVSAKVMFTDGSSDERSLVAITGSRLPSGRSVRS